MVRNSKRKAFTIVELVIVIAVIAILAAVMIPTFGGVIDSANLSADKQLLSTVNTQLSIYTGLGNKIETEADLWKALKGDFNGGSDLTAKFDPKSANKGYHYWYNIAKEQVELLKYDETDGLMNVNTGKMMLRADSVARAITGNGFASSPRCFGDANYNYYFLDTGSNDFAEFFKTLEDLSNKSLDEYNTAKGKITTLAEGNGDNKLLAGKLEEKMASTMVLTDKTPVGSTTDIKHVYIPENKTGNVDYTLDKGEGAVTISVDFNVNITIPENVKGGEALNAINAEVQKVETLKETGLQVSATITFSTESERDEKIKEIFGVGSVTGTITINGSVTANATEKEVTIGSEVIKLKYQNPVTEPVKVSADGNNVVSNYIALNKIKDGDIDIDLSYDILMGASGKTSYQDVEWEIVGAPAGVYLEGTKVKFNAEYVDTTETITLKAKPVAVNEEKMKEELAGTVTLTVVTVSDVTFDFETTVDNYKAQSANENEGVSVKYSDSKTYANFGNINLSYKTVAGNPVPFDEDQIKDLGTPVVTIIADNNYFKMNGNSLSFKEDGIKTIASTVTEEVTVEVKQIKDFTVKVSIKPSPFALGHTKYAGYTYTVGDDNAITLGKLFALSEYFTGLNVNDTVKVWTYTAGEDADGNPTERASTTYTLNKEGKTKWTDYEITLTSGTNLVEIGTNDSDNTFYVWVNVVDGKNVTTADEFVGTTDTEVTRVLHANLSGFTPSATSLLKLSGKSIYGNYFTIDASNLYDADYANGNAFISMTNGSLNQVVIDGPVYARGLMRAMDDKDKQSGFFYFGVALSGTKVEIFDSYLSGFNAPVFVSCATFNATDTVFEGGAWANIYIRSGVSVVNFNGVETIQNRVTGYITDQTKDVWTNAHSSGMGIFIHSSQASGLTLNLNDTKQYNWFASNDKEKDYADGNDAMSLTNIKYDYNGWKPDFTTIRFKNANYLKEALKEVFDGTHTDFLHSVSGVDYVNAGIVTLDYMEIPAITINIDSDVKYHEGTGDVGITIGTTTIGLGMKVWTYEHGSNCCSETAVNYRNGEAFDTFAECIADFLNDRKG